VYDLANQLLRFFANFAVILVQTILGIKVKDYKFQYNFELNVHILINFYVLTLQENLNIWQILIDDLF